MAIPQPSAALGIVNNNTVRRVWGHQPAKPPLRALPKTRRYEISYLDNSSEITSFTRVAPAIPVFEDAFSAIARGTIIATEQGPIAVEDLLPGVRVNTFENGFQTLLWSGSTTLIPNAKNQSDGMGRLSRITADSFGLGRPMPDLLLGPRARLLRRDAALVSALGLDTALVPITAFTDGETVLEITPVAPVRVYHLAFAKHQIILANGLEIESYHPGHLSELHMSYEMRGLFLTLFPHIRTLDDFGTLAYQRITNDAALGVLAA